MDPRFAVSREDLYSLQMEVKQVQYTQSNHAERLLRLEKRQADDAALKSVWNSPFPGVLSGTPQTGELIAHHCIVYFLTNPQVLSPFHIMTCLMIWMSKASSFWGLFILDQQRRSQSAEGLLRGLIVFDSTRAPCTAPAGVAQAIAIRETLALSAPEAVS